ncbi:IclR family transcriptional regulator [Sphaerotilus hippei]|uniref:IclR family transcriptional regulator n=1 Tax=Sphaerotilus hippei TaxID=744406 RepID=A0A318H9V6_9BURK|nr:IclR family transcriptional regulator C-terminal domain-containing protein [Sphaerotilus hippei]PXW95230.1 IclR family transcriptional regulator [Sphaerotilus hippei]
MTRTPRPDIDRSLLIEGLGKGLRVIESFTDDHPRMTATEAGQRTGLTRTAARRYLMSLVHYGYADTDGKHYWLLPSVLRLGQSYLEAARLPRLVQPFLQRLSMQTGETANLSVLDGHDVVYLVRSNSPRIISIGFQVGSRVPAHGVSPGAAVLATLDEPALDAWLATHDFGRFTTHTITDAERFRAVVAQARQLGYGLTEQQVDLGLCGLAVALTDRKGRCAGALSMTFQAHAYPEGSALQRLLPALQEAAQALRAIL